MGQWGFSCVFTRFPKFTTQLCPLFLSVCTHTHLPRVTKTQHTHTHSLVRKMSRLTYLGLTFPSTFYLVFPRAFPRLRLSFTVDVALKLKQKLKLISASSGALFRGDFPNSPEPLSAAIRVCCLRIGKMSWKRGVENRVPSETLPPEFAVFYPCFLLALKQNALSRSNNKMFQIVLDICDYFVSANLTCTIK